jgi:hypothetical protein
MKAQEEKAAMRNHGVPPQPQNTIIITKNVLYTATMFL